VHVFHVLFVCACIFQYAFPPDMPVRFSWRKTCLRCCRPKKHDKSIFAGWSLYVCVCIACMCMYRMYVHVFFRMHCASQIFLEENMSKMLLPPKSRQINFGRLGNVCMCLGMSSNPWLRVPAFFHKQDPQPK
jgi:hypothetical protein